MVRGCRSADLDPLALSHDTPPLLRVPGPFRTRRSEFQDRRGARCPAMAEPRGSGQGAVRPPCPPIAGFRTWMSGSWPIYSAQEASAGLRHPLRRSGICKQQPDAVVAPELTPRAAAEVAERLARAAIGPRYRDRSCVHLILDAAAGAPIGYARSGFPGEALAGSVTRDEDRS